MTPLVHFAPIARSELNDRLLAWGHRMGPVRRPSQGWSHGLFHEGALVAVIATDTLIRERVAGFSREQAVELSRLCAARADVTRVALRLWRAFVFPAIAELRGVTWALSCQDAVLHSGALYRFDGWARIAFSRSGADPRTGRRGRNKWIWGWCEDSALLRQRAELCVRRGGKEGARDVPSCHASPEVNGGAVPLAPAPSASRAVTDGRPRVPGRRIAPRFGALQPEEQHHVEPEGRSVHPRRGGVRSDDERVRHHRDPVGDRGDAGVRR